jgi:6-phosphogluconolactonase (cycloisomerase 2 family)
VAAVRFAIVGGFTTEKRRARGDGLRSFQAGAVSGAWRPAFHLPDIVNPSFLISGPKPGRFYAVHADCDYASAFAIGDTGAISLLGQVPTGGVNGVHLAADPSGQYLVVANYATGSVSVLPIENDGAIKPYIHRLDLPGAIGPNRIEQASSHPHHTVFDPSGRFLLVPDKGLDRVFVLAFDPRSGDLKLTGGGAVMRPGAGPRHIAFHPDSPVAFVVNELDSTVCVCGWDGANGVLTPFEVRTALPSHFVGASTAAAIAVSKCGRYVYASNRGQDGIVQYAYEKQEMRLRTIGWVPSHGRDPRFMCLDPGGEALIVANEQGDSIVWFGIDAQTGRLERQDREIRIASPSTIAFVSAPDSIL